MLALKLIDPKDTKLFNITDNLQEIVDAANKMGHPKISENFYDGFRDANFKKGQLGQGSN